jgi:hypothetical protein
MSKLTKLFALAVIAAFLATIPTAFADKPEVIKVVNEIRMDDNFAKGGAPEENQTASATPS